MPIDSVSSARPSAAQRLEQRRAGRDAGARCAVEVAGRPRGSPSGRAGAAAAAPRPRAPARGTSRRRQAALARLAADVDLQADRQRRAGRAGRCALSRSAIFSRSTVWTQSKRLGDDARLVALQRADQVPLEARRAGRPARRSCRAPPARSSRRSGAARRRAPRAIASTPKVLLTASNVTLCTGRPAAAQALAMRACTWASLSAIIASWRREVAPAAPLAGPIRHSLPKSHGHLRTAGVLGQEQGLRPAPVGRPAADDPRARRRAPHQLPPLEHKDVHDMVYDIMNDAQRKIYEENARVRLLVRDPGPGALPRQRLQPEPRRRRRVPDHSRRRSCRSRSSTRPKIFAEHRRPAARPGAGAPARPARASRPRWRRWSTTSTRTSTATS